MKLTAAAIPFLTVLATLGQSTQALSKDITTAAEKTVDAVGTLKSEALVGTDANVDAIAADVNAENEDGAALIEETSENGYHHYRRPHSEHHRHHHGHHAAKRDLMHRLKKVYDDAKAFLKEPKVKEYKEGLPKKKEDLLHLIRRVEACHDFKLEAHEFIEMMQHRDDLARDVDKILTEIEHNDMTVAERKELLRRYCDELRLLKKLRMNVSNLKYSATLDNEACQKSDGKPCQAAMDLMDDIQSSFSRTSELLEEEGQLEGKIAFGNALGNPVNHLKDELQTVKDRLKKSENNDQDLHDQFHAAIEGCKK